MIDRRTLAGALIGAISWGIGYFGTRALAEGMSAASAYAVLVGWWLTAYVSSRFALPFLAVVPLSVVYLALFIAAVLGDQSWFYRDVSSLPLSSVLGIGLIQAIFVSSPILFDGFFRQVVLFYSRHSKRAKQS
ncbi:hypothetical protein [Immundisolibacter cernigliae]|uniref:hypothetical protein n=1 Tax=Immundisolibacter cernigliae TaxID=1810504 RepID=UPI0011AB561C|nr:hypothetical protein [Immundisolibacter cernigliae]